MILIPILTILVILFSCIAMLSIITGNPGEEYILGNSNPLEIIIKNWMIHIAFATFFFSLSYAILGKIWNKIKI